MSKITGCVLGDVHCSERYAFQQLIIGPFKNKFSIEQLSKLNYIPDKILSELINLPQKITKRIDVSIHLR